MDEQKLVRYFSGIASEKEQQEVRAWIEANPSVRRALGAGPDTVSAWDADRAAAVLLEQIRHEAYRERRSQRPPERRPARRRVARRVRSASSRFLRYAAVAALVAVTVLTVQWLSSPTPAPPTAQQDEVVTGRGQRTTLRLADDTEVVLNAESRLRILDGFAQERREVYLQGKAFFDVTPQPDRPFIIHTNDATVRVLGTAFSVSAYEEQQEVRVAVAEGEVLLHPAQEDAPRDTVVLRPRDLGIASVSGLTLLHDVNLEQYHAWTEGRLVFEATPMDEVARELERWFDVQIRFTEPALEDRRLTAEFDDQSLNNILKIIALTLDVKFEHEEKVVTFSSESQSLK